MKSMRERYNNDPVFHTMVDTMVAHITTGNFTPSEMREAAIFASIIYEESHIRMMSFIEPEVEEALRVIRKRVDQA